MFLIKQRDPSFRESASLELSGKVDQALTFEIPAEKLARAAEILREARGGERTQAGRALEAETARDISCPLSERQAAQARKH
jgi:hypothetical protein